MRAKRDEKNYFCSSHERSIFHPRHHAVGEEEAMKRVSGVARDQREKDTHIYKNSSDGTVKRKKETR